MSKNEGCHVVGIGASAGGLDAVQTFFANIPENSGLAYVVIQHLSPDFKSLMPDLLAKYTNMEIFTAEHMQEIKPNCVYLNNRNYNLGIENNHFVLINKDPNLQLNLPIDIFFHTLGKNKKDKGIGIILSGTGSDGSRGIKTIKEMNGTVLVQNPESAQFDGMPLSSILTNVPDFILPVKEIAETVVNYVKNNNKLTSNNLNYLSLNNEKANDNTFESILTLIHEHTDIDFTKYKSNTLLRRLEKRINLHNIDTLEDYLEYLKKNKEEIVAIHNDFLIGVTTFFRDKEAFKVIKEEVIPNLCFNRGYNDTIRLWIPGCSSGEEVYSIAVLLEDYIISNNLTIDYKIFATDIDKKALSYASRGAYSVNNIEDIDKEILEKYFIKSGGNIEIISRVRDKIIFSYHDVTADPPFIKLDLISCRNLLIYFSNDTQKNVLAGFQFALNKDGILFLGSSESLGAISSLFSTLNNKFKIFKNLKATRRINKKNEAYNYPKLRSISPLKELVKRNQSPVLEKDNELSYYKILSQKHAPVSVFVDHEGNVEFVLGSFKKWFNQNDGSFDRNIFQMVNPKMSSIIRNGLRRVEKSGKSISIKNIVYTEEDGKDLVSDLYFDIIKKNSLDKPKFLIQFGESVPSEADKRIHLTNDDISEFSKHRIESLEQELNFKNQQLQNIVEELETSNEELQSSNEELMSSNEELQSSNEELQSVNEELYTVNSEFQEKNRELEDLNNDMINLLSSSDIGTLFLDIDLNIRKFTPEIKRIFNLESIDIGRSLTAFTSNFNPETRNTLIENSKRALEDLKTFEDEIQDIYGNWYLKRINPFITFDKKIEGVVIAFIGINEIKEKEEELKKNRFYINKAQEITKVGSWYLDVESNEISYTDVMYKMYELNPSKEIPPFNEHQKIFTEESWNLITKCNEEAINKGLPYDIEIETKKLKEKPKWIWTKAEPLYDENGKVTAIWGVSQDITERKEQELKLIEAQRKAESANIYKNQFLANMSHEIRTPMNGLLGFANMLRQDGLDTETRNTYVNIIENCTNQLLVLTGDIIDISKIEAGELTIKNEPFKLYSLFEELKTTFNEIKKTLDKEHIELRTAIPKSVENIIIESDIIRLKQALSNLIDNALKFTPKGFVEFGYRVVDKKITMRVSDSGIGIPKDKLDRIFKRFERLEHRDSKKEAGTGLGLSISQGIIELLGGKIKVTSELEKGTTFIIEMPYKENKKAIKDDE